MLNERKHAQTIVYILLFLQVGRVAHLLSDKLDTPYWQALAFSLAIAWAISVSSRWTRTEREQGDAKKEQSRVTELRVSAWVSLVFFVVVDGTLNLTDVLNGSELKELDWVRWLYGLVPTIAAALLGMLQGRIDKFPVPPNPTSFEARTKHIWKLLLDGIFDDFERWVKGEDGSKANKHQQVVVPPNQNNPTPQTPPTQRRGVYKNCPGCDKPCDTRYEWAGHAHNCKPLAEWKIANPRMKP
jgi:hypothetical protein